MRNRVGDTLIEVTLAIGIFSLVAITIVAVMNGGTSSTQTALETTLAREEIDTQAEAIRFIHDAYMADIDSDVNTDDNTSNTPYVGLWREMTGKALDIYENENIASLLTDTISCNNIYDDENALSEYAFVINPRKLNEPENAFVDFADGQLTTTQTYPRLIYSENNNNEEGTEALISGNSISSLKRAEGIYVVPVFNSKDETVLIKDNAANPDSVSTYYDFYIRTCWYGTGDDIPSSISTIVRLYDPEALASSSIKTANYVKINYKMSGHREITNGPSSYKVYPGETITLTEPETSNNEAWEVNGYYIGDKNNKLFQEGSYEVDGFSCEDRKCTYKAPDELKRSRTINIKVDWNHKGSTINYALGGGSGPKTQICYLDEDKCNISTTIPTRELSEFGGYATSDSPNEVVYTKEQIQQGVSIDNPKKDITLYAYWKENASFDNKDWKDYTALNDNQCKIESSGNTITLTGSKTGPVNCGKAFNYGKNDDFTMTAEFTAETFSTHPSGLFAVNMGPVVVVFRSEGRAYTIGGPINISYGYLPLSNTLSSSDINSASHYTEDSNKTDKYDGAITLTLKKEGNKYTISTLGSACKNYSAPSSSFWNSGGTYTCSDGAREEVKGSYSITDNSSGDLKVRYTMIHGNHSCDFLYKASLSDIEMTRWFYGQ